MYCLAKRTGNTSDTKEVARSPPLRACGVEGPRGPTTHQEEGRTLPPPALLGTYVPNVR